MEVMQSLSYPRDLMCALEAWALEQRPVFIVGVPRSGTTRLSNIISSSPEFSRERGDAVRDTFGLSAKFLQVERSWSTAAIFGRQVWCRQHH